MGKVCKYNICKGMSTFLTIGTPIITLCSCSDMFVHRADTAISAAGVFTILIMLLFAKDKLVEHFKMPSAFVVCVITLLLILVVESIILPIKYVCIATLCTTAVDELSFKRFYKSIELDFTDKDSAKKFAGFMFTTTNSLSGDKQ